MPRLPPPAGSGAGSAWQGSVARSALTQLDEQALGKMKIEPGDLDLGSKPRKLGKGGFGRVYQARFFGVESAVKVLEGAGREEDSLLLKEASIMYELRHDHVVQVRGVCMETRLGGGDILGMGLVMQLAELGSIRDVLHSPESAAQQACARALSEWKALFGFLSKAAHGLSYLHSRQLVHSDIKPSNLLVTASHSPLIADMGLSGSVGGTEKGGTVSYRAPESFDDDGPLSAASDCYAFALVMWFVAAAATADDGPSSVQEPWHGQSVTKIIKLVVDQEKRPEIPADWHDEALLPRFVQTLERGWAAEAGSRLTMRMTAAQLQAFSDEAMSPQELHAASSSSSGLSSSFPGKFDHLGDSRWEKLSNKSVKAFGLQPSSPTLDAVEQGLLRTCRSLYAAEPMNARFLDDHPPLTVTALHSKRGLEAMCTYALSLSHRADAQRGWDAGPFKATWHERPFQRYGPQDQVEQTAEEVKRREKVRERFTVYSNRMQEVLPLLSNLPSLRWVELHTVFHGCKDVETAKKICSSGFAQLASLDPGFYGQGLYFTFDLSYAVKYAKLANSAGPPCILVCDVVFGNLYPVIEDPDSPRQPDADTLGRVPSLLGQPMVPKYDAHGAVVHRESGRPSGAPGSVTELVLFESSAILPRCILSLQA